MHYEIQRFEGHGFRMENTVWRGEPVWRCADVSIQIGYSRRNQLASKIREWAGEIIEGRHFYKLTGQDAREVQAAFEDIDSMSSKTRSLLVLNEEGINLTTMFARTDRCRELRWFMAEVVMPAVRRGLTVPGLGRGDGGNSGMGQLIARIEDFNNRQMDMFGPTRASLELALKGQRALQAMRREDRLQRESEAKLERARAQRLRAQERMLKTLGAMNDIPDEIRSALLADLAKGA